MTQLERRSFFAISAAAGVFGFVLVAASAYAQTIPAVEVKASVISLLPRTLSGAVHDYGVPPLPD